MEYFFLTVIILILLVGVFLTFRFSSKKELRKDKKNYYRKEIQKISDFPSPSERIMKYDVVLHHILKDYGYSGNVGDQLKAKPRVIHDLNTIWSLHKLRNKLAHSMDTISEELLERKAEEFEKEILRLL
ncbi:hypothetical protein GW819_03540 [Candidatus Gracilibacteria bacterium]|nr:hypothetical protein [Candidatus Gracilibacteria bacterium]OIO78279.1 MAG: hypothetical protein AUJ87_00170 [Candidatus Gracilibacteria bacterium CG1_02_38_174]PIQ12350.1 MAG: hypothetical protein COW68_00195 [Candidatus Gracilibacteria bacterium CG18_big_fil_WC_8_21_14_2_50_38_16]PIQ41928.1 MAG: hypothetical protein COW06_01420 [Candidatus Gracilibacteria bacterium CG12_big_fil_rev_8_21_14_0_65_38_15]